VQRSFLQHRSKVARLERQDLVNRGHLLNGPIESPRRHREIEPQGDLRRGFSLRWDCRQPKRRAEASRFAGCPRKCNCQNLTLTLAYRLRPSASYTPDQVLPLQAPVTQLPDRVIGGSLSSTLFTPTRRVTLLETVAAAERSR
jgi:hypothetical protein